MDRMAYDAMLDDLDHREEYPEMYNEKGEFKRVEDKHCIDVTEKEQNKEKRKWHYKHL